MPAADPIFVPVPVPGPVPGPGPGPTRNRDTIRAEHFRFYDGIQEFTRTSCNTRSRFLPATKLVSNSRSVNEYDSNLAPHPLTSNGHWIPDLESVPLASYYKLHRVPSLSAMDGSEPNDKPIVPLPRRESTTEPLSERPVTNGIHNKVLENVIRTPGRQPSPQPTHLSVPGSGQHRMLHETGPGYVAPKFEGKELQMEQGKLLEGDFWVTNTNMADRFLAQSWTRLRRKVSFPRSS